MTSRAEEYDIIIVGAGPAGSASAMYAHRHGLKVLLIDKESFPRDKICGDALSGKSVTALRELDLIDKVWALPGADIQRIVFSNPDHRELNIDLRSSHIKNQPKGFVVRRQIFDEMMFNEAKSVADKVLTNFSVTDVIIENGFVKGVKGKAAGDKTEQHFYGKITFAADGYNSTIARKLNLYEHNSEHLIVALRCYYKNVSDLSDQIELHFVDEVLPAYFWIFPVEDGYANIGIGMVHKDLKEKKIDLKAALQQVINSEHFRGRFANAEPMEKPVGWNLPVGSLHRKNHGNGFMLLGDAAGLIDPFTGEGIGNALYSARFAVPTAKKAIEINDVSEASLAEYDRLLWKSIGNELSVSTKLQRISRFRPLINFVINKAARNPEVAGIIAGMMANEVPRKDLANPLFYLKLLVK
jgi:geranylgeranyl reductase family protein